MSVGYVSVTGSVSGRCWYVSVVGNVSVVGMSVCVGNVSVVGSRLLSHLIICVASEHKKCC